MWIRVDRNTKQDVVDRESFGAGLSSSRISKSIARKKNRIDVRLRVREKVARTFLSALARIAEQK